MSAGFVSTNVTVDPTRPPVQAIAPVGEVWTDVTTAAPGDTITVWARCSTATSGTGEPTWVTMGMSLMDPVGDLEDILTGEIVTGTNGTVSSDITFPDNATLGQLTLSGVTRWWSRGGWVGCRLGRGGPW
jgi:hypothetical protein